MNRFEKYRRKGLSEMRPFKEGEILHKRVSISEADLKNGSPKIGDMIARNPKSHEDQWLVAKAYFEDNLEEVSSIIQDEKSSYKEERTLLDWFAGKAMQGYIGGKAGMYIYKNGYYKNIAEKAYEMAMEMLQQKYKVEEE